jgi:DNA-binding NtrC family response regulator
MSEAAQPGKGVILVAEDEEGVRESLAEVLREEGYEVTAVADGQAALAAIDKGDFDLVLSDIRMPGADGLELLRHVRAVAPQTLFLFMTAHASVETAVEALRRGAQDYLLKPLVFEEALYKVGHFLKNRQLAWENQVLRHQVERHWDFESLVGRSAAMREVVRLVQRVAPTRSTVLITGESGAGKEVVARAVHHYSPLRDRIFLPINCAAIPENLLESQLFGHVRGAFTGAVSNQEGMFQRARGGTIFLDEIGDLPLNLQAKLLRALEQREILPVGATTPVKADVRIIAATNQSLARGVEEGKFREDLFYRLNVFEINIPPLRERRDDVPVLVDHFVRLHNEEQKKRFKGVDAAAMRLLVSLPWKGNVRELQNVIEHAMIVGEGDWITVRDLPPPLQQQEGASLPATDNLREALRVHEKMHIQNVLNRVDQDKRAAADLLGISLSSLYRKLEELDIGTGSDGSP